MTDANLYVVHRGAGPPIVVTHGLGDDADTWAPIVPQLSAAHEVVMWDLRGHARSESGPGTEYSRELAISDLAGIVESTEERCHLVGHSLGGYLSLAYALREPDRVETLTLIASGPGYRDANARADWNRYVDERVRSFPIPSDAAALCYQEDSSVIDALHELTVPVLAIVGSRDTRFHPGVDYLERRLGCAVVRVDGAGHHPQRTHAAAVAAAIAQHVER